MPSPTKTHQATQPALQSLAPTTTAISQSSKPTNSPNLFATLDWQYTPTSTPPSSKPTTPSSPAPKQAVPHPAAINPHHRSHSASPAQSHVSKSNMPHNSDGPDLLDFSTPLPKSAPQSHYPSPPVATPTGFYSPQPPRPNYSLGPPAYQSPQQNSMQPNRTIPGQDPLAQFTLQKPQSTGGVDDFDPLAKKPAQPTPSTPPSHQQQTSQLSAPPVSQSSRTKGHPPPSSNENSLIFF